MKSKSKKKVKNYSEIYKKNLMNFVKRKNTEGINLYNLVSLKYEELSAPNTPKEQNYFTIMAFSLYFIKNNDFIQEEFFSLVNNSIFKIFNDFLQNPTEEQHEKFLKSFEDLNYGFGNIYLICKKLLTNPLFKDNAVDLFFRIILKEPFEALKDNFPFPIKKDQKALIKSLTQFIKIKYNNNQVTKEETFNLFKEDTPTELTNIPSNKNAIQNENKMVDNLININISSNNNEIVEEKLIQNQLFTYLAEKENEYKKRNFKTPILNYLIKNKNKLKIDYFRKIKKEDSFVDHYYDYLENLLFLINSDSINFQDNKIGYFCFFNKNINKYFEGIYSNIDLKFLFEKVVSDKNFPADDIYDPDETIAKNAFKSRALSFEYYINGEILLNKLKVKERQRVIYIFKDIDDIESLDKEENPQNRDATLDYIIEVDGVVLENIYREIYLDKNFFIPDPVNKFGFFENNNNMIENYHLTKQNKNDEEDDDNEDYKFYLDKNCLCIIEIKNQFPPFIENKINKELNQRNDALKNKYPSDFATIVKALIKKSLIFKEMFEQLGEKIDYIKLVLFYDAVHKINYENLLNEVMNELFKKEDVQLLSMIEFQCIYIKSSYLAGGLSNYKRELNKMEYKLAKQEKEIDGMKKLISNLKEEINSLKASNKKIENDNDVKGNFDNQNIKENNQVNDIKMKQKEETKNDAIKSKESLGNKQLDNNNNDC